MNLSQGELWTRRATGRRCEVVAVVDGRVHYWEECDRSQLPLHGRTLQWHWLHEWGQNFELSDPDVDTPVIVHG